MRFQMLAGREAGSVRAVPGGVLLNGEGRRRPVEVRSDI